jgi:transposase
MMAGEFWFSDRQWAVIEPLLSRNQPGARRVDDRRVLSGIVHVLRSGSRWQDCPQV